MPLRRFSNPWPHPPHRIRDVVKWKLGMIRDKFEPLDDTSKPAAKRVIDPVELSRLPPVGCRVTWLGHASFLLQTARQSFLIDPIFSSHCAPFPMPGLRRLVAPPCGIADLPKIDAIFITHSHYDHLDLDTLRKLGTSTRIWVPQGHATWLAKKGFSNVAEVSWWERVKIAADTWLTATPAQHFTARYPWDRDLAHWCGWLLESNSCRIWHAGDSGYCDGFRELGNRVGPIDFAMIPIGAYRPRELMRSMHMDPYEAVAVFEDAQCRRAVAMHWGTFQLTDEPIGEPPRLLAEALKKRGFPPDCFVAGAIGESWLALPST